MKILTENIKKKLSPFFPYGVLDSWDDLNPRLYHGLHIYWLKFYGMWYNDFSPKDIRYWLQKMYTLSVLFIACLMPGIGAVVYLLKRTENVGDVAEGLYLFLTEMYAYFKVTVFWLNKDKVKSLLAYMHCEEFKPKEAEHKEIILKSIKTARWVITYYTGMCLVAVVVGVVMPLTENFEFLPTNVEYPFFDVYQSPFYEIFYMHHLYYKPATCIIDGAIDNLLAAFAASASGQMDILAFNLRNFESLAEKRRKTDIIENKPSGAYSKDYHAKTVFKDCIIHHNCIIRYVSMIEGAFSFASALQLMLSAMVLCLVGVQLLSIENPGSHPMQIMWVAIYLVCMLFEVFILCWFGDEIIWKSSELSKAAYEGPWLNTTPQNMQYVVLFVERCKRPLSVTAGKVFILSLDTYTILINWAYKAFALMSNMKK